ncbi:unnamed protein product [Schistocephalus solidus]|uniref:Uncharacterized protein n=1 Tax=Schistocephalus solidus TaxID=70667 RepID=A0A183SBJ3_SCHSO|nr:unnamed protein product [Schistocephalus solidus]
MLQPPSLPPHRLPLSRSYQRSALLPATNQPVPQHQPQASLSLTNRWTTYLHS